MRNCNLFGTKSELPWNTARQDTSVDLHRLFPVSHPLPFIPPLRISVPFLPPLHLIFQSSAPTGPAPSRFISLAFRPFRPPSGPLSTPPHPVPSCPPSGPFRLFTSHTPLVFDHLVVFLSRKRQNRRFGAGGTCKRGRRGHQSKQLPTKHQVAEGARGQKQERDHPDLPRTVDFDVLDVIF